MSESQSVPGQNKSEIPPETADMVQTEPLDTAWLMALPHFLGSFSIFSAYCGFLFPLFLWLAKRDEDPRVAAECRKALNFQGVYLIFYLVFSVLLQIIEIFVATTQETIGLLRIFGHVSIVVNLLVFGFSCLAGYKVRGGHEARYPIGIDLIAEFTRKGATKKTQRG